MYFVSICGILKTGEKGQKLNYSGLVCISSQLRPAAKETKLVITAKTLLSTYARSPLMGSCLCSRTELKNLK